MFYLKKEKTETKQFIRFSLRNRRNQYNKIMKCKIPMYFCICLVCWYHLHASANGVANKGIQNIDDGYKSLTLLECCSFFSSAYTHARTIFLFLAALHVNLRFLVFDLCSTLCHTKKCTLHSSIESYARSLFTLTRKMYTKKVAKIFRFYCIINILFRLCLVAAL